jgi:asparagine synthase (glutamine-hydrolysing)
MCGILALARVSSEPVTTRPVVAATALVAHRGPDDEGYLLWTGTPKPNVYAGPGTAAVTRRARRLEDVPAVAPWRVAFGHRRLSIVDLSPGGHQPQVHEPTGLAITYNGEIYNHVELRQDLERRGYVFRSNSDTEVLLTAWAEWGPACLPRLNGMFAFVVLDPRRSGTLHAVRDRFGVKPLYWARVGDWLAFSSEVKQLRALPGYTLRLDESTATDYLARGILDHTSHTFDAAIQQLRGGEQAVVALDATLPAVQVSRWYDLAPRPWGGTPVEAAEGFRDLLADSVRLRLRADVPVGSCLSGGLDSSSIVSLAARALKEQSRHAGQVTVTACFADERYDEWRYAKEVVAEAGASAVTVWPTVDQLQRDLDRQLWHMDEPFGSTSQFSQWCVFAAAAEAGLKVMLDGQGGDEQLGGYGGTTTVALLAGLLKRGELGAFVHEVAALRAARGAFPLAEIVLAVRNLAPPLAALLPARHRYAASAPDWLRSSAPSRIPTIAPTELQETLRQQTLALSLPALLRYEDRNSMAWSIEARVPFLDYRLVEFLAGLPDGFKIRDGATKVVLRNGMRGVVPEPVLARRDKMGFVTPEERWVREAVPGWVRDALEDALAVSGWIVDPDRARRFLADTLAGRVPYSFALWRIICFGRWLRSLDVAGTP